MGATSIQWCDRSINPIRARPVIAEQTVEQVRQRATEEFLWPDGTSFGNPLGDHKFNGRVVILKDRKGGDPTEWPEDLRVRQFPRADAT
jgi:hypothetical protein